MEPGTKANQLPVKGRLVYPFLFLPSPSAISPRPALTHMMSERSNPHHRNGERLPALSLTVEPLPVLTHRNEWVTPKK